FGTFNVYETPNFAIKWGNYTGFSLADVQSLGDAFETSWDKEVSDLAFPAPIGTESYKFNVYVGDSGAGAPSSLGSAGYYWYDDDGWPMIVVGASQLADRGNASLTAAHELFHAVQAAVGTLGYDQQAAWYTEATAVWMENEVWPGNPAYAAFLYWFAIRPELSLNHFKYPSTGSPEEYHQYGAFVFVEYLTETRGDPGIVRRSFLEARVNGDPLVVLDDLLREEGSTVEEAFFDHIAHNATWDYEHEDWYEGWIDAYGGWTGDSHRPAGRTDGETTGWVVAERYLPRTFGAAYWELRSLPEGGTVSFDGRVDTDVPAQWHAVVAVQEGTEHRRVEIPLVEDAGTLEIDDLGSFDEAWLVVGAADGFVDRGDAWAYALRVEAPVVEDPGSEDDRKACGCANVGHVPAWAWVVALVTWRRSRVSSARRRSRSR
ncbi:MAG: hypothetical protein JRI25_10145, partial [Deltaproteobacteria bacterium]|nr:hypothetical protein [Deltaproteobacteria bacterium]